MKKQIFCVVLAFVVVAFSSCRQQQGLSGLVPAAGVVYYDGKPLAGATVTFAPVAPENRASFGTTKADGTFVMWTLNANDGTYPGDYNVSVAKSTITFPVTIEESKAYLVKYGFPPETQSRNDIPDSYFNTATSGLTVTVPPKGIKNIEFKLVP